MAIWAHSDGAILPQDQAGGRRGGEKMLAPRDGIDYPLRLIEPGR